MRKLIFYACFSLCFSAFMPAQEVEYGLAFRSHEVEKEKRTGLDITPEKPFSFSNGFSLSFDILIKEKSYQKSIETKLFEPIFGYILRMEGNNHQNIDLVLKPESETPATVAASPTIILTCSEAESLVNYKFSEHGNTYNEWIHIAMRVETDKNQLDVSIGKEKYTFTINTLHEFKNVRIAFGKNDYLKSFIRDIPPMIIKDITIGDTKQKPLYHWRLSKHTATGVYDELKNHYAVCSNPLWILDKYTNWEKQLSIDIRKNPQICYNEKENCVAFADDINFLTYNATSKTLQKDLLTYGKPCGYLVNQLVYDELEGKYCSYSFEQKASFYDPAGKKWDNNKPDTNIYYWHHNRYIYPGDSCLYMFFGYGHHKYESQILQYDFKTDSLEKIAFSGDRIPPRYLSGLGKIDDRRIIIFGGYGSETGNQESSPKNYYDAYIIDLKSRTMQKLWELNSIDHNFVVANSLIVDTLHHCFYALCFPQQKFNSHFSLYKFSIDRPEYETLADSIPFAFHDIYSYANLFLNKQDNELIAVTSSPLVTDSTSTLSIYTLAFPPLSQADLYQKEARWESKTWYIPAGIIGIFILSSLIYSYYRRKKSRKEEREKEPENKIPDSIVNLTLEYEPVVNIKPVTTRIEKQSIFLFGGFQVMDKEGRNITGEFTPLLKQLFIIILLYTLKDGKGISSLKLREALWFDKSNESAKNNRGVSMNKLRQILEQIGEIHVKSLNLYWIVEFGKAIYCDYYEALILMHRLRENSSRTNKDIKRLLSIVSAGELLPNLQIEWVDSFKADFANDLADLFLDMLQQPGLDNSDQDRINLADSILIHDSLNEEALKIKCTILIGMGKYGLAKKTYSSFSKEYRLLFGTDFKQSFEQIISLKNLVFSPSKGQRN